MRTGPLWDLLGVAALVVPLGALLPALRRFAAPVSFGLWLVLLLADARPSVGSFAPDALALAVAAGAALAAATGPPVVALPIVASLVGLVAGVADPGGGNAVLLLAAVATAGLAVLLGAGDETRAAVAAVVLPVAVLGALRAGTVPTWVTVVAGLVAVAVAVGVVGGRVPPAGAIAPLAVAVASSPLAVAFPAAALLGAAAVLAAAGRTPWALVAAVPGAAVVARALADVPAVDADVAAMFAVTAALAAVATAISTTADRSAEREPAPAVLLLAGWLVVVPGSWRWAVPDAALLAGWDRAAAVAVAAGLAACALRAALGLRRDGNAVVARQ